MVSLQNENDGSWAAVSRTPPRDWYRDARVRSGARPTPVHGGDGGAYFAPELQPHVLHPVVERQGRDVARELLRRALGRYLHATSFLEIRVVNRVAAELAHGSLGRDLLARARFEALQITCDEGYHAVLASDLLSQIGGERLSEPPAFFTRLGRLCELHARSTEEAGFVRFLFTVVTETAISASMQQLARSPVVLPAVREFVADHARDEAWHGAYFSALFTTFWSRLGPDERSRHGQLLPALVHAFLAPDTDAIAADLVAVGLSPSEAASVVADACSPAAQRETIRRGAVPVLTCFRRAGALSGDTHDAFVRAGLVERGR